MHIYMIFIINKLQFKYATLFIKTDNPNNFQPLPWIMISQAGGLVRSSSVKGEVFSSEYGGGRRGGTEGQDGRREQDVGGRVLVMAGCGDWSLLALLI